MNKLETIIILSISAPIAFVIFLIIYREFKLKKLKMQLVDENFSEMNSLEKLIKHLQTRGWHKYRYEFGKAVDDTNKLLSSLNNQLSELDKNTGKNLLSLKIVNLEREIKKERILLKIEKLNEIKITPEYSQKRKHDYYKDSEECYKNLLHMQSLWVNAEHKINAVLNQVGESIESVGLEQSSESEGLINSNKSFSVLSSMSNMTVSENIDELNGLIKELQKQLDLVVYFNKDFKNFVSSYTDVYDLFVGFTFDFNFDYSGVLKLIQLQDAENQVEQLKKDLKPLKAMIKERRDSFDLKVNTHLDILY